MLKALRAMNAADAADQALRQVEKMMRINGRASRDSRLSKVIYFKEEDVGILRISTVDSICHLISEF